MKDSTAIADAITAMIKELALIEGIEIEICGTWIWVSGDTYPARDSLKALDFRWASVKKMWHWTPDTKRRRSKAMSMQWIRDQYGSMILTESESYREETAV